MKDFIEWVYDTKEEAQEVLKQMDKLIASDCFVSVDTFYESFTDSYPPKDIEKVAKSHGWINLDGAYITDYLIEEHRYKLYLPKPISLYIKGAIPNCKTELIGMESVDMVAHPPHYQSKTGLEVINVIEAFTSDLKGIEATDTGNVIKYICRWKHKNGVQDLEKAKWYLEHLISQVKEKENEK